MQPKLFSHPCTRVSCIGASLLAYSSFLPAVAADLVQDVSFDPATTGIRTQLDALFSDYRLIEIDLDQLTATVQSAGQATLRLSDTDYTLRLYSHNLRTPQLSWSHTDFVAETSEPLPPAQTYRGSVADRPGSDVRLSIAPDLLLGYIQTDDAWLFLEPLSRFVPGAAADKVVVYRADRMLGYSACTGPAPSAPALARPLTVTAEADGEFFAQHGARSQHVIEGLVSMMDGYLQRTTGQELALAFQHVWTDAATDPYTATDRQMLLDEFSAEWGTARYPLTADLAYLFTGKTVAGSTPLAAEVCGSTLVWSDNGTTAYALAGGASVATGAVVGNMIEAGLASTAAAKSSFTAATAPPKAASITVTEPNGINDKVAEGRDYATYELGNRWDMSDAADVVLTESAGLTNEVLPAPGGLYTATVTGDDPNFFLVHPSLTGTVNLSKGTRFPIDTSRYRYLTLRVRVSGTAQAQPLQAFFLADGSYGSGTFGFTDFVFIPANTWTIVTLDLYTQQPNGFPTWQSFSQIRGIRIDAAAPGVTLELDWARLTAAPNATPAQKTVQWTASGLGAATFSVQVLDGASDPYTLVSGLPAGTTSYVADFSRFQPGSYSVRVVASNGTSDTSDGFVTVNQAPIFNFTQPDAAGDTANDYATVVAGNPWGPFDPADIAEASSLTNQSFTGGVYSATSVGGLSSDPAIRLNVPTPIDSSRYRMLSYRFELEGARDIQNGSVTRILWGNAVGLDARTSRDIIVEEGLNTYVIGDLAAIPIEPGVPSDWGNGNFSFFRFDPHEFSTPRTVRLHSIRLAPYDTAAPTFNLAWQDSDSDNNASIALYYDLDTIPFNGNETLIANNLGEDGANTFNWNASAVASGAYHILSRISDGLNTTDRYATGPLKVEGVSNTTLAAISTRGQVSPGNGTLIAGIIIDGSSPKTVLLRGRGPSVNIPSGQLANPYLDLVGSNGAVIVGNDNWQQAANAAAIQATGRAPANAQDAAILVTLNPGAYTARLSGVSNTSGVAIVEAFAIDTTSRLSAISTRGQVSPGNGTLIAGIIIDGSSPKTVLLRGRGPSVNIPSGQLANPYLDLVGSNGAVIVGNDNWQQAANAAAIQATGRAPANAQDAAILVTLNPGAYTARLSGVSNTSGVAIVEVFDLD